MFKLVLSQIDQIKSKLGIKFNSFRILKITLIIGSWSNELKNIFLKCRETLRNAKAKIRFTQFGDRRRTERVF